ncbi:MAG: ABC transporter ATP-binding protein [Solirubrobacterales bacterium]|nr:ABC transporter ATP-binding protein [Solirubrobacterales bacterium]
MSADRSTAAVAARRDERTPAATLEFDGVSKRYPGASGPALDNVSFTVPAGEVCVLVGPSGCGKTTAMRLVNRMIDLSDGDIRLDGDSVISRDPTTLRREIGYVIQQIGLFPHFTIADNIATVPKLLGWDKKRIQARVAELLEVVSLPPEMAKRYPRQLSGGQQQRVGVARALAADPPLMLMDEPFGAIDPITRDRLQDEFLRLQREIRKTIVFVTHDIDEAIKMGDKIAIMREGGHLVQFDSPAEILTRPADEFVARFVGIDRALKRLTLRRLHDLEMAPVPAAQVGDDAGPVYERVAASPLDELIVVDGEGKPLGRVGADRLQAESRVPDSRLDPVGVTAPETWTLRDGLAMVMTDGNRPLLVLDEAGRAAGVVTVEQLSGALRPNGSPAPTVPERGDPEVSA